MTLLLVGLGFGTLLLVLLLGWWGLRHRRHTRLKQHFGPEYERTVAVLEDPAQAEAELAARRDRVAQLPLRPLTGAEQVQAAAAWQMVQARFAVDPVAALTEAERLLRAVASQQGYAAETFPEQAAALSVRYPQLMPAYRAAHYTTDAGSRGFATPEQLQQALGDYHALLLALLGTAPEITG